MLKDFQVKRISKYVAAPANLLKKKKDSGTCIFL